jgi:hypothetical protein
VKKWCNGGVTHDQPIKALANPKEEKSTKCLPLLKGRKNEDQFMLFLCTFIPFFPCTTITITIIVIIIATIFIIITIVISTTTTPSSMSPSLFPHYHHYLTP